MRRPATVSRLARVTCTVLLAGSGPAGVAGQADTTATARGAALRLTPAAAVAGIGVLAALAADEPIRTWIQSDALQGSRVLQDATDVLTPLGGPVPFVGVAALYGIGYLTASPDLMDTGLHMGAGIVATGVVAGGIKVLVGRLRPYVPPHDAGAFFRGSVLDIDSKRWSFPSGHTSIAFAVAGALTEEVGTHWPTKKRVVAPVAYGFATGVAFARVYTDRHWTSDVLAGAVIGGLVGPAVVRWAHARKAGGPVARLAFLPGPDPGVAVHVPLR